MAMNEAGKQPAMNLSLARVYLLHSERPSSVGGRRRLRSACHPIFKTALRNPRSLLKSS
jgi:hypothetical protein